MRRSLFGSTSPSRNCVSRSSVAAVCTMPPVCAMWSSLRLSTTTALHVSFLFYRTRAVAFFRLQVFAAVFASFSRRFLKVPHDLQMSSESGTLYCFCQQPDDGSLMVECEGCAKWFHGRCVNFSSEDSGSTFTCDVCAIQGCLSHPTPETREEILKKTAAYGPISSEEFVKLLKGSTEEQRRARFDAAQTELAEELERLGEPALLRYVYETTFEEMMGYMGVPR
ncbi:hypothetical protein L596_029031 [Steinernema carpocapsae]|uniref:PHD-type domain-containing protein n=1 Tax=Steinernema carpocapsae TaxID=34508 RepID=A0A4V5ZXC8_STECR|nr:hypothetical protein L596_029031 [Steinernema carpocapsae]